jgi:acyl-CoA thioesterase I
MRKWRRPRAAVGPLARAALLAAAIACGGGQGRSVPDTAEAGEPSPAPLTDSAQPSRAGAGAPAADGKKVVLFLGTSLTAGLGLDPEDAFPALIQRKADSAGLAVRVENAGLSGETSAGALRRVDWLLRGPVDVFVLETGANDGLRGLDVDSTRHNIERIVARVRSTRPDARIFLVQMEAPPNLGTKYTDQFRAMFPAVARETGATLLPFLLDGVAGVPSLNQPDGIHPNEQGARRLASNVWRGLSPALTERP